MVHRIRMGDGFQVGLQFLLERAVMVAKREPPERPESLRKRIAGLDAIKNLRIEPGFENAAAVAAGLQVMRRTIEPVGSPGTELEFAL